jgi:transketolase
MRNELSEIRRNIVRMAHDARASHVGSALSVVEILWAVYGVKRPGDKLILSKGHASAALYAVLAQRGELPAAVLEKCYYVDGGMLPGHLDMASSESISASAGSLGHGAGLGLGMALADRCRSVYVVLGDGECDEGSVWEAAEYSGARKVKNLKFIIDNNGLQIFGRTKDINGDNFAAKFRAFGHEVAEVDGHDVAALSAALKGSASVVVARTVKGRGVSFMENRPEWHGRVPDDDDLARALGELGDA